MQAFLRTICDRPTDPGPKLVFADWLEEQGDPWAELIRTSIELAEIGPPHKKTDISRTLGSGHYLVGSVTRSLNPIEVGDRVDAKHPLNSKVIRGLLVTKIANNIEEDAYAIKDEKSKRHDTKRFKQLSRQVEQLRQKHGWRIVETLLDPIFVPWTSTSMFAQLESGFDVDWKWRDGFPADFRMALETYQKYGKRLEETCPVVDLKISDKEPMQLEGSWGWVRNEHPLDNRSHALPHFIYDNLFAAGYSSREDAIKEMILVTRNQIRK